MADPQRYLNILKMPRQAIGSVPTFASATSAGGESTFFSKVLKGLLYISLIVLILCIVLVIIHYIRIYYGMSGILNFGDNPNALINLMPQTADWKKYWIDTFSTVTDSEMPNIDYTILFDVIILEDKDVLQNRPSILFYRNIVNEAARNGSYTFTSYTGNSISAGTPSMYVVYNAHTSELQIVIKLSKTVSGTVQYSKRELIVPIVAQKQYRIAVNVSDKLAEVYKNGTWMQSVVFGNDGSPNGDKTDSFYYTPTDIDKKAVRVRNLMLISPMVTSGIIRNMGGPSINLDDLKKDAAGNICQS